MKRCARAVRADLVALDLPGYAIGGLSVGETREEMDRVARFTAALLPADKPRYLMGVGTVRDLVAGIDRGIDLFDCVYPTRSGRHGRVLTRGGSEYNIRVAANVRDFGPLDPGLRLPGLRHLHQGVPRPPVPVRRDARAAAALVPQRRGADGPRAGGPRRDRSRSLGVVSRRTHRLIKGPCSPPSNSGGVRCRLSRSAVVCAALVAWNAAAAAAEPVETTVSVTVNALSGKHEVDGGQSDTLSSHRSRSAS